MTEKTELFKVMLDCVRLLTGFIPYAYDGKACSEGMIKSKMREVADKLLVAVGDEE